MTRPSWFPPQASLLQRLAALAPCFAKARQGVAIVEFAVVLPVMLILLLGMMQVTTAIAIDRKLSLLTRALADLASRDATLDKATMDTIFAASSSILQPYDASRTQMVISSIKVTKVGSTALGTVLWSCGKNVSTGPDRLGPRTVGTTYQVPDGYESFSSFIVAETQMPFTPMVGYVFTGEVKLGQVSPWALRDTRSVDYVTLSNGCPSN